MDFGDAKYVNFGLSKPKETEDKPSILKKFVSYFKAPKQAASDSCVIVSRYEDLNESNIAPSILDSSTVNRDHNQKCFLEVSSSNPIDANTASAHPDDVSSHPLATAVMTTHSGSRQSSKPSSVSLKQMSDRRYWMLDESCRYCFECGCRFTTIRRRHHCRVCGRIFCHQCSNQVVDGHLIGMSGLQRSCTYCAYTLLAVPDSVQKRAGGIYKESSVAVPLSTTRSHSTSLLTTNSDSLTSATTELHLRGDELTGEDVNTGAENIEEGDPFTSGMSANLSVISNICSNSSLLGTVEDVTLCQNGGSTTVTGNTSLVRPLRSSRDEQHSLDWMIPAVRSETGSGGSGTSPVNTAAIHLKKHSGRDAVADSSLQSQIHATGTSKTSDLSDSKIINLWFSMVNEPLERGVEAIGYSSPLSDESGTVVSSGSSKLDTRKPILSQWNQGELQIISVTGSDPSTVCYCAFGFNLVYWLVSNVPELGRSREKARGICQRFLELSLMSEMNTDGLGKEFRDDFTPYEIKKVVHPIDDVPRRGASRPAWPYSWFMRSSPQSPTLRASESDRLMEMCNISSDTMSLLVDQSGGGRFDSSGSLVQKPRSLASITVKDLAVPPESQMLLSQPSPLLDRRTSSGSTSAEITDSTNNLVVERKIDPTQPTDLVYQDVHPTIKDAYSDHIYRMVRQDVRDNCLDVSIWTSTLISLAHAVCNLISFDLRTTGLRRQPVSISSETEMSNEAVCSDELSVASRRYPRPVYTQMDPRYYVHVKKLVDEPTLRSELFTGLVFTKRAANRHMVSRRQNPRILLLASSITYQRTPTKLTRLESQIMQEEQYLSNCVSKLLLLQPQVIFVGGTVSHLAQTFLLEAGVTLFCNVKQTVLRRLSRITGADILSSVDRLVSGDIGSKSSTTKQAATQLGVCHQFEIRQLLLNDGSVKFLTQLKVDAETVVTGAVTGASPGRHITREATVLLHGPRLSELKRAKRCLLFAISICYNAKLEMSYSAAIFLRHVPSVSPAYAKENTDYDDDPSTALPASDLARYLGDRVLNMSPSVPIHIPFLASREGQRAPLLAYYTYVIDWPLGRQLNDLLKRKSKVMDAELYEVEQGLIKRRSLPERPLPTSTTPPHSFLTPTFMIGTSSDDTRKSGDLRLFSTQKQGGHSTGLPGNAMRPSDEAAYVDFKARGAGWNTAVTKFTRLWAGKGSLLSGWWDVLLQSTLRSEGLGGRWKHVNLGIKERPQVNSRVNRNAIENYYLKRLERSILDARSHQSLSFLTTLFTPKSFMWPEPCVPPWIASVEYYGRQDLPLGLFLEKFCFLQQRCRHPHCEVPMIEHIQRFVQTTGSVQLITRKLSQPLSPPATHPTEPNSGSNPPRRPESRLQMWLFCPTCQTSSPVLQMPTDVWHLSFVKFLDLVINTPTAWGRCTTIAGADGNDKRSIQVYSGGTSATLPATSSAPAVTGQAATGTGSQPSHPSASDQMICSHSPHKTLLHCFARDQKMAIFKFQPVTVFEIVMPPSEIEILATAFSPTVQAKYLSFSASASTPKASPSGGRHQKPCPVDSDTRPVPVSSAPMPVATTALLACLKTEALEVLKRYFRCYISVKSHIVNLQKHESSSSDFSPLLKTFFYLLESESHKEEMGLRAELLAYLLSLSDDDKTRSATHSGLHDDSTVKQGSGANSLSCLSVNPESEPAPVTTVTDSVPETPAPVQQHGLEAKNELAVTASELPPILRLEPLQTACSESDSRSSVNEAESAAATSETEQDDASQTQVGDCSDLDAGGAEHLTWASVLPELETAECVCLMQNLINELKRYTYSFVCDWNSKFSEFSGLCKRVEKSNRDSRKRHTAVASTASGHSGPSAPDLSRVPSASELQPHGHRESSTLATPRDSLLASGQTQTTSGASDANDDCGLDASGENRPHQDPLLTSASEIWKTLSLSLDKGAGRREEEERGGLAIPINTHPLSLSADTQNQEVAASSPLKKSTDCLSVDAVAGDVTAMIKGVGESASQVHCSPPLASSGVHELAHAASHVSHSTSGMRRFISTLLPSSVSGDMKVLEQPFPANEHPQLPPPTPLRLPHNNCMPSTLGRQSRFASHRHYLFSQVVEEQLLRFSQPDVYVNDCELTSIIAYALSTPEYERKLVDLHSSQATPVHIGQSVLADTSSHQLSTPSSGQIASSGLPSPALTPNASRAGPLACSSQTQTVSLDVLKSNCPPNRSPEPPAHSDNYAWGTGSSVTLSSLAPPTTPPAVSSQPPAGSTASANRPETTAATSFSNPTSRHIRVQFSDSSTNFFCCVYYATEFFRLRQLVLPQGDIGYIRSLSRCYQWDAQGGKSGSLFMKTRDERFVVKELSAIEMKTFHEISQQYFDYLIGAAMEQRLCVLSRILGIFHIGYKNSVTGDGHRFDVLVMENLFHDRTHLAFIYDLKGSLRKRLVDESTAFKSNPSGEQSSEASAPGGESTNAHNQANGGSRSGDCPSSQTNPSNRNLLNHVPVLLDQNLVNASIDNPLYLRVHSKNALSHCLQVDTAFLANLFIMDYSLLVGIDRTTDQLVIGLIDYLRKFTLDKRLEMLIKQTITSAQGPMPTILTPDLYRERFLLQMDSYFPLLPDHWYDSLAEHAEAWRGRSGVVKPSSTSRPANGSVNADHANANRGHSVASARNTTSSRSQVTSF